MQYKSRFVIVLMALLVIMSNLSLAVAQPEQPFAPINLRNHPLFDNTTKKAPQNLAPMPQDSITYGSRAVPPNDNFADAHALTEADFPFSHTVVDVQDATVEPNEPSHDICSEAYDYEVVPHHSVWYKLELSAEYMITLSTLNSAYETDDTVVSMYTGNTLETLEAVLCADDDGAGGGYSYFKHLLLNAGTYYIQVSSYDPLVLDSTLELEITGHVALPPADLVVNTTNDTSDILIGDGICQDINGDCSLRAAIEETSAIKAGSTITLPAGTYASPNDFVIERSVSIIGAGSADTIITNNNVAVPISMIYTLPGVNFNLSGVTLTMTKGLYAGALTLTDGVHTLDDIVVKNSTGIPAGGIFFFDVIQATLSNSKIHNNTANDPMSAVAGGIFALGGTVIIQDTDIYDNQGKEVGGVVGQQTDLTLKNVNIYDNLSTDGAGGALFVTASINLTVTDSNLYDNKALIGGGLVIADSDAQISNTNIYDNVATYANSRGGGIISVDAIIDIENSAIYNNTATYASGIMAHDNSVYNISNSTISSNIGLSAIESLTNDAMNEDPVFNFEFSTVAKNNGGGINSGTVNFVASIIYGNIGGDCTNATDFTSDANNLFHESGGCPIGASDIEGTVILADVLDVNLALNGGDTMSHALIEGSLAIDGVTADTIVLPLLDQRGKSRPIGDAADIGAFEFEPEPTPTETPTGEPTEEPTATGTPTEEPTPTSTPTGEPTEEPTAEPTSTATGTPTEEPTPTATPTGEPTEEPDGIELIVNGDFEDDINDWKVKNATKDKLKCNKPDKNKFFANTGDCAFMFKGSTGENSKIVQKPSIEGITANAGDTLHFSFFIHAKKQPTAKYKVVVKYNDSETKTKINGNLNEQTEGYVPVTNDQQLLSADVSKVKVIISNKTTKGKFFVDTLSLKLISGSTTPEADLIGLPEAQFSQQ